MTGIEPWLYAVAPPSVHHRTDLINFLEPPDAFLDALGVDVTRQSDSELSVEDHLGSELAVALLEPPRA